MNALTRVPPAASISGFYWSGRSTWLRLYVDLSDGQQLSFRWDDTCAYVGLSLHNSEYDECGRDIVATEAGLPLGIVEELVHTFQQRVEAES